jgi:hypothetical protein
LPNPWNTLSINLPTTSDSHDDQVVEVDISSIHDRFVADMTHFALRWNESHTAELLDVIPTAAFRHESFARVAQIAQDSQLCSQFTKSVVLLRALLLHHFNFIRLLRHSEVPPALWQSFTGFVAAEEAAAALLDAVVSVAVEPKNVPFLAIDRRAAHGLIRDGSRETSRSIISQVSGSLRKIGAKAFRAKGNRPWRIRFVDEPAIDAGGPAHELITETAASIFEGSSGVVIQAPDSKTFVPWGGHGGIEFWGIGCFLGIVVRTGLSQDLPFCPFVWKYIAGERLGIADVVAVDPELGDVFKGLRDGTATTTWCIRNWDGRVHVLPRREEKAVGTDDIETYVNECVAFRIRAVTPFLKLIRKGFRENVGFKRHTLMTGAVLSRLAQGSATVSLEHLRAVTRVSERHFPSGQNDEFIRRFWRIVERFSPEQRKLLLKFVTTLTRLPNSTIFSDFRIAIDAWSGRNPDEALPTASTCFTLLHLPRYTNDDVAFAKIAYAIQNCQLMENQ